MIKGRPSPVTIAAILLALFSLLNLAFPLFPAEGIPAFVAYSAVALGVLGLVAVAGLWMLRRWGIWLTVVVSVLNTLAAAPGVVDAPNGGLRVAAVATVVGFVFVVVLVMLPASRRAYA